MNLTPELSYLAATALFTAVMWIPYILNLIVVRGPRDAMGYPADPKPMAPWAERLKAAHYNSVENLVVFAPLVLVAHVAGVGSPTTATACAVFFWARVVYAVVYALGIPYLRTLVFAVGWLAMIVLGVELIA